MSNNSGLKQDRLFYAKIIAGLGKGTLPILTSAKPVPSCSWDWPHKSWQSATAQHVAVQKKKLCEKIGRKVGFFGEIKEQWIFYGFVIFTNQSLRAEINELEICKKMAWVKYFNYYFLENLKFRLRVEFQSSLSKFTPRVTIILQM